MLIGGFSSGTCYKECQRAKNQDRLNFVLYVPETMRAESLGQCSLWPVAGWRVRRYNRKQMALNRVVCPASARK